MINLPESYRTQVMYPSEVFYRKKFHRNKIPMKQKKHRLHGTFFISRYFINSGREIRTLDTTGMNRVL